MERIKDIDGIEVKELNQMDIDFHPNNLYG